MRLICLMGAKHMPESDGIVMSNIAINFILLI